MKHVAVVLVLVMAATAVADRMDIGHPQFAIPSQAAVGGRFIEFHTGFEPPLYLPGGIGGQDGWTNGSGGVMQVVTNIAIDTQSLQSNGSLGWGAFRTVGNNPGGGVFNWSWYFEGATADPYGAEQQMIIQSPTDGYVITRVARHWVTETLRVLHNVGGSAVWANLGYDIAHNQWVGFSLQVGADNSFSLLMNGNPIFSGIGFSNNLEQVVVYNDFYPGNTMYVDNIGVIPEPASLLLLGLAGLLIRRR